MAGEGAAGGINAHRMLVLRSDKLQGKVVKRSAPCHCGKMVAAGFA